MAMNTISMRDIFIIIIGIILGYTIGYAVNKTEHDKVFDEINKMTQSPLFN